MSSITARLHRYKPTATISYLAAALACITGALYFVAADLEDDSWGTPTDLIGALSLTGMSACALLAAAISAFRQFSSAHTSKSTFNTSPLVYALYIALGYATVGCLYILFSTHLAHLLANSAESFKYFELIKGYLFILITSWLLLGLTYLLFRRIIRDTEEIIVQKEALIEASKRATTGVFAASIAHDGGNILASLRFCLELLGRSRALTGTGAELLDNMRRAVSELSALNRRLLETGQRGLSNELFERDLIIEIRGALSLARINQRAKYCQISLEGDAELISLINPSLINEMLLNLILNAADATENRGRIIVYAYRVEDTAHIEVHDNGPGIPKEKQEKIFDPFYTTKKEGSGLGLLTVKACAELHQGLLRVDRSPLLGGALFAITFPIKKEISHTSKTAM